MASRNIEDYIGIFVTRLSIVITLKLNRDGTC